eukprot:7180250-Pyramimonas_sp.AAC.1
MYDGCRPPRAPRNDGNSQRGLLLSDPFRASPFARVSITATLDLENMHPMTRTFEIGVGAGTREA